MYYHDLGIYNFVFLIFKLYPATGYVTIIRCRSDKFKHFKYIYIISILHILSSKYLRLAGIHKG